MPEVQMDAHDGIRVLCVDDHALMRLGISTIISRQPDMTMVGAVATAEEALSIVRTHSPDIVLVDLRLPRMSGNDLIRQLSLEAPEIRSIVLTMYSGDEDIYRALQAGASTCLLKDSLVDELPQMVRAVYHGDTIQPPAVVQALADREGREDLTRREREVVSLIAKGLRNKEIARDLGVSIETVNCHVKRIRIKLGVNDKNSILAVALKRGFVHLP